MAADDYKFTALLGQIIVRAWFDKKFLTSLTENSQAILNSYGLHPPPGLEIAVHADKDGIKHVICHPDWLAKYGQNFVNKLKTEPKTALLSIKHKIDPESDYKILFNSSSTMHIVVPILPHPLECSIEKIR